MVRDAEACDPYDGSMVYCSHNFHQKRFYFQCLLRLEDLRKRGLRSMYSEELQSYYRCLLRGHLISILERIRNIQAASNVQDVTSKPRKTT